MSRARAHEAEFWLVCVLATIAQALLVLDMALLAHA